MIDIVNISVLTIFTSHLDISIQPVLSRVNVHIVFSLAQMDNWSCPLFLEFDVVVYDIYIFCLHGYRILVTVIFILIIIQAYEIKCTVPVINS